MDGKILLISDMHGRNPTTLIKQFLDDGIEGVVFLGDYDTPEVLRDLRKLKIKKKFIIGNHDYHFVCKIGKLSSQIMRRSSEEYFKLWEDNLEEKTFVIDAIKNRKKEAGLVLEERLGKKKVVYCHGGIVNKFSPHPQIPGYFWQRMFIGEKENREVIEENLASMVEKRYWIMFRGHDHIPIVIKSKRNSKEIEYIYEENISLERDKIHIATIGPFYSGYFALFNPTTGIIEYKRTSL